MQHGPNSFLISLFAVVILLPLMYRRIRKMSRPQPLKQERLWLRPVLILAVCALALFAPQPGHHVVRQLTVPDWGWLVLAGTAGAVGGWYMGRTMAIEVHPQDGTLMVKGSAAAILVIVVLLLFRFGLRAGVAMEAQAWHLDALLISDALIVFSAALFTMRSLEMYLRAQRVMKAAHGAA